MSARAVLRIPGFMRRPRFVDAKQRNCLVAWESYATRVRPRCSASHRARTTPITTATVMTRLAGVTALPRASRRKNSIRHPTMTAVAGIWRAAQTTHSTASPKAIQAATSRAFMWHFYGKGNPCGLDHRPVQWQAPVTLRWKILRSTIAPAAFETRNSRRYSRRSSPMPQSPNTVPLASTGTGVQRIGLPLSLNGDLSISGGSLSASVQPGSHSRPNA